MDEGNTEEIWDENELFRRVPAANPNYLREDGSPTSLAFLPKKDTKGLSVDVAQLTTPEKSIINKRSFQLFQITAGEVRNIDQQCDCIHDPLPENYAHALITGLNRKRSKKLSKKAVRIRC